MPVEDALRATVTQAADQANSAVAPNTVRREMIESLKRELIGDTLTVDEVAEILDFDRQTVLRYLRDNTIIGFQLGREWRVPVDELRAYFQQMVERQKEQARRAQVEREVDAKVRRIQEAKPKDYPKKIYCPDCGYAMVVTFGSEFNMEFEVTNYYYAGKCEQTQCSSAYIRWLSEDELQDNEPKRGEDESMDDIPF